MPDYALRQKLQGSKGPVNALIFSLDGKFLLSGGDDDCVRVWNIETFQCEQVLHNPKWGQITTFTWIFTETTITEKVSSICVGTGRGFVALVPMSSENSWFIWKDATFKTPFGFNDAVEAQSYDALHQRLAVASHSGQIKMYEIENHATLRSLWAVKIGDAIPSAVTFFGGANQSLLIHGTESGEMCCRDSQNSNVLWTKTLAGGIGNAVLSSDETTLLVDNLSTGTFDMYRFPATIPTTSFPLTSTKCITKQCVFAEGGKVAVCGSDQGRVHVVDLTTSELRQSLRSEFTHDVFQAVASTIVSGHKHLIAGGSSGSTSDIYIWEKDTALLTEAEVLAPAVARAAFPSGRMWQSGLHVVSAAVIILMTYPNWSFLFWQSVSRLSGNLSRVFNAVASFSSDQPR